MVPPTRVPNHKLGIAESRPLFDTRAVHQRLYRDWCTQFGCLQTPRLRSTTPLNAETPLNSRVLKYRYRGSKPTEQD